MKKDVKQILQSFKNSWGCEVWNQLPENCQIGLVSLAYNPGAKNTREAVAPYVEAGNLKKIPDVIRGHRPTGNIGETPVNLSKRRQNEAQLFEKGLRDMEQQSWSAGAFNSGLSAPAVVAVCVTSGVGLLTGYLFYRWCFGKEDLRPLRIRLQRRR